MSVGNKPKEGNKGSNHSYQSKNLQLLSQISGLVGLGATEATLQLVLSAIQDGQDFEAKIVVDDNGNGTTYLEVRIWNPDTQSWEAPLYYLPGSNTGVPASSLIAPINYINNGAVLAQIYTELLAQGLTLDDIELNTDNLEALLTTIDTVLDNSLVQLQAINANTDQLEALSTDIKNLLTTIDTDTGNIATSVAALELCCQATNTLLTTIDGVLDQIQTNTLNTVNELTTANVTLNDIEGELISLNSTAGTLATEATLELVRLQLVALNATDFATEATVSTLATQATLAAQAADIATIEANIALLNAKFNTFGREPEATSTPFAIDQEAYNALLAIQTAVQNIDSDLGTGGLALDLTVQATNTLLTTIDAVLDTIKVDTAAMVVDLAAIEVLITNTNALLTTIDGVLDAIKLDTANLDVALSTRLNTLGRKPETGSAPVVLSDEDFASLEAIRVAVQNLDVDVDGIATEVTLAALLTAFNAEDFATETTLASLAGTDFATQTTLAALLTAFNAEDFASQTTLQALLTAFNAEDFSTETTLAALLAAFNAEDFATETTLNAIKLQTDQMSFDGNSALEVSLPAGTVSSRYTRLAGIGSYTVPAGNTKASILNYGSVAVTVDNGFGPIQLDPGIGLDFAAPEGKTLGAITTASTSASALVAITQVAN